MDTKATTPMQNNRKAISAGELYVLLDREFRTRQSRECRSCYILLPFRVDRIDESSANWELILPADCAFGCAVLVEEIAEEYAKMYDLAPDPGGE
jgi:hypothetical protein